MGNEGVDINRGVSPDSSPDTVLSHCGEFQESKVGVFRVVWFNLVQFRIVSYTKPHKTTPTLRQNHTVYTKRHQVHQNYSNYASLTSTKLTTATTSIKLNYTKHTELTRLHRSISTTLTTSEWYSFFIYCWIHKLARWRESCVLIGFSNSQIGISCPRGIFRVGPVQKFPSQPYNKSVIDQACSVKMAGFWPLSFFGLVYK